MKSLIVVFGEAEKGQLKKPYLCHSLEQLIDDLGNPPEDTGGLELAIQTLLFNCNLLFFRVQQEGFSIEDYTYGIRYLESNWIDKKIDAIGIPGVGDRRILDATDNVVKHFKSLLIITEKDLYDYMTSRN